MICKWNVEVNSQVQAIGGGPVLMVGWQETNGWVQVWTQEPEGSDVRRNRKVRVYATGEEVSDTCTHLGSAICGPFVWHVYEENQA